MKFFNSVNKANAELTAAEEALKPDLEKAGITTAQRDGKTIPIADATLAEKYIALRAAQPAGTDLQARAELLESNQVIATRCEKAESDLAIANTSVGTLTRENSSLKDQFATAQSSVTSLTAEKANVTNLRDAAVLQHAAAVKELNAEKSALAEDCLTIGCLTLNGEDGKALAADASKEVKLAAAMKLSFAELRTSFKAAVTTAVAKTGVALFDIPAAGAKEKAKHWNDKDLSVDERSRLYRAAHAGKN